MEVPSWRRIPMRKKHPRLGKSDWHLRSGPGGKSRAGWMEPPSFVWEKWGEWKRTSNHALLRSKSIEVLKLSYCQLLPSLGGSWLGNKYIDEKNQSKTSIHSFLWHDSWPAYYLMASRRPNSPGICWLSYKIIESQTQWAVIQQNWWCCRPWCRIPAVWMACVFPVQSELGVFFLVAFHGIPVKIHVGYVRI